ncbi:MAG: MerR family transcriptional regulator [Elusimicrobia bacterium]|nr:MerR family transcriptional regulator [Elusimicrobiota bacterium]
MSGPELRPLFPDQEFFNIGEAARIVQVPDYTLRYWETHLRLLRPVRRESGHRRYTRRDLETILKVKALMQNGTMTLAGAKEALLQDKRRRRPKEPLPPGAQDAAAHKLLRDLRDDLRAILTEFSR